MKKSLTIFSMILLLTIIACDEQQPIIDRESKIPSNAVKVTLYTDLSPVESFTDEYDKPIPLQYPINTKGAEDSAFITGDDLYFFFTPDVNVPVKKQILDGVTGIYVSKRKGDSWANPQKVILQDAKKLSGDGCEFVLGNKMWFCTVREGHIGIHWATAQLKDGKWQDWKVDDFDPSYEVGELHITRDENELYFHSSREGGEGGLDIWMSKKANGVWQEPINLENVNGKSDEGWPALNMAEDELWISKDYGIWRSKKIGGVWQEPEKMFFPLAGEATIDSKGNVYFTHHFYKNDKMIEADIYVAKKR